MKIISAVFIAILLHGGGSEKCEINNFNVLWKMVGSQKDEHAKILDVHTNNPGIIETTPGQTVNEICKDTFSKLHNMFLLKLNSSGITAIEPRSFENNENLFYLNLSANSLENIPAGVFNGTSIRLLRLDGNSIEKIHSDAFDNMPRLQVIYLNFNKLEDVDSKWFKNTTNITHLLLEGNRIKTLKANAFTNLKRRVTAPYDLSIDLSKNKIQSIDKRAFDGLEELSNLWLGYNKIYTLHEDTFSSLKRIGLLDLLSNQIKCFPENLSVFRKISRIEVSDNPLECNCLKDLKSWSRIHNISLHTGAAYKSCLVFERK